MVSGHDVVPELVFQSDAQAPAELQPTHEEGDIFAKIERLAELRQKGILSEEEFAGKKSKLMSRL